MSESQAKEKTTLNVRLNKTLRYYGTAALAGWRDAICPIVRPQFQRPVFVVGCSRSGTTAVYKVIGMAHGIASMQRESHDFWNQLHPLSENNWDSHILTASSVTEKDRGEVLRFFYRNLGAGRFVDKANQNCFRIPYLKELFPDAIFVYVKRDGRDNVNSLIHGWGRPDEFGIWSNGLPENIEVEKGTYRRWSFFLFPGWRAYLHSSIEEVCAHQWMAANEAILDAREGVPDDQWAEIVYEDILNDAPGAFKQVFEKVDVPFTEPLWKFCENLVANPYNAFSAPRIEKWKDENPDRIKHILSLIEPTMKKMGYSLH